MKTYYILLNWWKKQGLGKKLVIIYSIIPILILISVFYNFLLIKINSNTLTYDCGDFGKCSFWGMIYWTFLLIILALIAGPFQAFLYEPYQLGRIFEGNFLITLTFLYYYSIPVVILIRLHRKKEKTKKEIMAIRVLAVILPLIIIYIIASTIYFYVTNPNYTFFPSKH